MKKIQWIVFVGVGLIFSLAACKKAYNPPEINVGTNFLVVDGTISVGNNAITTITLSRTTRLSDSILFNPEINASVYIDADGIGSFVLDQKSDGVYQSQPLTLPVGGRYRLRIDAGGKEYTSPFMLAKTSPAIDSLTWRQDEDAVISVHTHDPANNTRYYKWDYTETWSYSSFFHAEWTVINNFVYVSDSLIQTDSCWRTANSTNIRVGSSVALTNDVISYFPVATIPQDDEKLSKRYSILVRQYAISDEAFRYMELIRKNTEQMGTLFDGQPSQLKGNIQAADNPNEPVIGFVTASTVTEKRIFINHDQLNDWHFISNGPNCNETFIIAQNPVDYRIWDYPNPLYTIYYYMNGGVMTIARKACMDCRERGGVNRKPSFW
jgi:hypothetical protein